MAANTARNPNSRSWHQMSPDLDHDPDTHTQSADMDDSKPRKLRKGTHSCWGCKRRKVKCTFSSKNDTTCIGCARRGATCVSQEEPEDAYQDENSRVEVRDRIVRVEKLLSHLVEKTNLIQATRTQPAATGGRPPPYGTSDDGSDLSEPPPYLPLREPLHPKLGIEGHTPDATASSPSLKTPDSQGFIPAPSNHFNTTQYAELVESLLQAYPSQHDLHLLTQRELSDTLYNHPRGNRFGTMAPKWEVIPTPDTHPVLVAKHMLGLASYIQKLNITQTTQFSESPRQIRTRLADRAIKLVTTNEEFQGTVECLECIIQEATYQSSNGNLRRSWLAHRRAITVAQLMGCNQLNGGPFKTIEQSKKFDAQFTWHRLVHSDRWTSLLLGLPQGTTDKSMASEAALAADTPHGRIERLHSLAAAQLLERNEHAPNDPEGGWESTQKIDALLLRASKELSPKDWLVPDLAGLRPHVGDGFWEGARMVDQMFHHFLLHLLHLPYLLHFNSDRKYEYSRITCLSSSRELLQRFVIFRRYSRVTNCCRPADFTALIASMTLVLAHLDSHGRQDTTYNFLAHQRLCDRAMMDQVLETMEVCAQINEDPLTGKSAALLRQLMELEEKASRGQIIRAEATSENTTDDDANGLRLSMPYFKSVKVSQGSQLSRGSETGYGNTNNPQGLDVALTKAAQQPAKRYPTGSIWVAGHFISLGLEPDDINIIGPTLNPDIGPGSELAQIQQARRQREQEEQQQQQQLQVSSSTVPAASSTTEIAKQFEGGVVPAAAEYYSNNETMVNAPADFNPGLVAGLDDWAFQGVETAYFENLMRGGIPAIMEEVGNWPTDML